MWYMDVGKTGRHRGVEGVWDTDSSHIHWPQVGEGGAVGGTTYSIRSLCAGEGV